MVDPAYPSDIGNLPQRSNQGRRDHPSCAQPPTHGGLPDLGGAVLGAARRVGGGRRCRRRRRRGSPGSVDITMALVAAAAQDGHGELSSVKCHVLCVSKLDLLTLAPYHTHMPHMLLTMSRRT